MMKVRAALAGFALAAAGIVGATVTASPAQAAIAAPSKACYPVCTPGLSSTRVVVAPGYRLTYKAVNFKPKTSIFLSIPDGGTDSLVTSATGAATLHIVSPRDPGKYRVTAVAAGQSASIYIYVPRYSGPASCKVDVACRFTTGPIEAGTAVKFISSGSTSTCAPVPGTNGEQAACLATYSKKKASASWRLVTGFVAGTGSTAVLP